jgi:hypothetical protein
MARFDGIIAGIGNQSRLLNDRFSENVVGTANQSWDELEKLIEGTRNQSSLLDEKPRFSIARTFSWRCKRTKLQPSGSCSGPAEARAKAFRKIKLARSAQAQDYRA